MMDRYHQDFEIAIVKNNDCEPLLAPTRRLAIKKARQIAVKEKSDVILYLPQGYSQRVEHIRVPKTTIQ